MAFTAEFVAAQILELETALAENTLAAKSARKQYSYSLDSGQTRQSVTAQQLSQLTSERKQILSELAHWTSQLFGGRAHTSRPGW